MFVSINQACAKCLDFDKLTHIFVDGRRMKDKFASWASKMILIQDRDVAQEAGERRVQHSNHHESLSQSSAVGVSMIRGNINKSNMPKFFLLGSNQESQDRPHFPSSREIPGRLG